MAVSFFKLRIYGTDYTKLESIKDFINQKIESNDLNLNLDNKIAVIDKSNDTEGEFILSVNLYIKSSIDINKYNNFVKNKLNTFNKKGLRKIEVKQFDNCSHDLPKEQFYPCTSTIRYLWEDI